MIFQSISFGDSASSKVFDLLKDRNIGYYIASEDSFLVNGSDRVYDMYQELSLLNYEQQNRKKEISQLIDQLLANDEKNYDLIMKYLNGLESSN